MQPVGQKDPSQALIDAWPYLGGLIVLAIVGGLVILAIRRRLLSKGHAEADESLMQTLRRMRDHGEISHAEYEASVRSIAHRAAQRAEQRAEQRAADVQAAPASAARIPVPKPRQAERPGPRLAPPTPNPPPKALPTEPSVDDFPPLTELPPDDPGPGR